MLTEDERRETEKFREELGILSDDLVLEDRHDDEFPQVRVAEHTASPRNASKDKVGEESRRRKSKRKMVKESRRRNRRKK